MLVVFIHGTVAAGKRTIGLALSEATGLPLFHNHLTVDLARTLFDLFSEPFVRLRADVWRASFAEAARAGRSFIFTFTPESSVDPALVPELVRIVEDAGGEVHFVELRCSREEIIRRLPNADRSNKLNDPSEFEEAERRGSFEFPPMPQPSVIVNTDAVTPGEAVTQILGTITVR
jgi:chloramphenicol 3-O-phosphotransferase